MTDNKTSLAASNLLFSIEERSKLPSPVASWMPPMLAVIQKFQSMERAIRDVLADSESKDGGWGPDITTRSILKEALDYDPLQ